MRLPLAEGICFCFEGFVMGDGRVSGLVDEEALGFLPVSFWVELVCWRESCTLEPVG